MIATSSVLGLTACAKSFDQGILAHSLPTPSGKNATHPLIYASPTPSPSPSTATPTATETAPPKNIPPGVLIKILPPTKPESKTWAKSDAPIIDLKFDAKTMTEVPTNPFTFFTRNFGQAFGLYDKGRLEKPDTMPLSGDGFLKVFQDRNRGYGALDLLTIVQSAAKEIHRDIPATESVQIGDLSEEKGGTIHGHASHQNGLDVDLVYFKKNHAVMPITGSAKGATGFDENFVRLDGSVTENFDVATNWRFIQILVSTGRIDRIFADSRIKKTFCTYAVAEGKRAEWSETLRKLRHWPDHQDHMHVRLACPANSAGCKPIAAIPAGDGCDALLKKKGEFFRVEGILNPAVDRIEDRVDLPGSPDDHGC